MKSVFMTLKKLCIIHGLTILLTHPIQSQNLELSLPREASMGGSLLLVSGATLYMAKHYPSNPNGMGNTWKAPWIDDWNNPNLNTQQARISDLTFLGTAAATAAVSLALPKNQRFEYGVITAQNVWITGNLVQLTKILAQRNRPYIQGTGPIAGEGKDNYYSFFSGHAALSSTLATSAILATCKNAHGEIAWGKATAITGGALAVTTGILRITAGKHYPSDVLTGMLVGTSIAIINTLIHENK